MKVEIEIVGVGERRTGVSKSGKPYDFVTIHFIYKDKHTEGFAAGSCMVSGEVFERCHLQVDMATEALLIYQNYKPMLYFV